MTRTKIGTRVTSFVPDEILFNLRQIGKELGLKKDSEIVRECLKFAESIENLKDCLAFQMGKTNYLQFLKTRGNQKCESESSATE